MERWARWARWERADMSTHRRRDLQCSRRPLGLLRAFDRLGARSPGNSWSDRAPANGRGRCADAPLGPDQSEGGTRTVGGERARCGSLVCFRTRPSIIVLISQLHNSQRENHTPLSRATAATSVRRIRFTDRHRNDRQAAKRSLLPCSRGEKQQLQSPKCPQVCLGKV